MARMGPHDRTSFETGRRAFDPLVAVVLIGVVVVTPAWITLLGWALLKLLRGLVAVAA